MLLVVGRARSGTEPLEDSFQQPMAQESIPTRPTMGLYGRFARPPSSPPSTCLCASVFPTAILPSLTTLLSCCSFTHLPPRLPHRLEQTVTEPARLLVLRADSSFSTESDSTSLS